MRPLRSYAIVCGLVLAACLGGLSLAQPAGPPPTGLPPGAFQPPPDLPPPIEAPPNAAPPSEEPPPSAPGDVTGRTAPPPELPSTIIEDVKEQKEKPAATTPLPEKAPTPLKRPRRGEAIVQALDKVTAQTVRFPVTVNKPVRWKDLVFTVHACEDPAGDEGQKGAFAHIEVYSEPRVGPGRTPPPSKMVYRGWMFAEAPAVHAFEHPVYDVWLIACRTA